MFANSYHGVRRESMGVAEGETVLLQGLFVQLKCFGFPTLGHADGGQGEHGHSGSNHASVFQGHTCTQIRSN